MGPSQEAKGSPWRQASSSSSCLVRTGAIKQKWKCAVVMATVAKQERDEKLSE